MFKFSYTNKQGELATPPWLPFFLTNQISLATFVEDHLVTSTI